MAKWRKYAKLDREPGRPKPLPGYEWRPVIIDIYGQKVKVMQMTKEALPVN